VIIDLPGLGRVRLRASARGLVAVDLDPRGGSDERGACIEQAAAELVDYAAGRRRLFTVALDLSGLTPFRRRVLERLRAVPFGASTTYGALAAASGSPGAARAIGGAVGANPLAIIIPCHRVLAAGGALGGFSGGLAWKRRLLAHEGITAR